MLYHIGHFDIFTTKWELGFRISPNIQNIKFQIKHRKKWTVNICGSPAYGFMRGMGIRMRNFVF